MEKYGIANQGGIKIARKKKITKEDIILYIIIATFVIGAVYGIIYSFEKFIRTTQSSNGVPISDYETIGKKVSITGYFDSQENMYSIVYAKYLEDQPLYKNGKAGTIISIAVHNHVSKEEYFRKSD